MSEPSLINRKLLLGVTGGIAAYKSAELVRLLRKAGAEVQVMMTADAARFITPLTLGTLSEREVLTDVFPENAQGSWTKHVTLGNWGELLVIAPATAQTIAKLAHGFCDSMLTATVLAARCPVLVCPAMDHDMYLHPATQENLNRLRSFGYEIMEPAYGSLASGLTGVGRLPEPEDILARIQDEMKMSGANGKLIGKTVLVTAGATREHIDPVRFISNPSTGTMGFALAAAAARQGARVILVAGPSTLTAPSGVERMDVTSAREMHEVVLQHADEAELVFMAAAVGDFAPPEIAPSKIKKTEDDLVLALRRTPDILKELGSKRRPGQVLVGFAMETDNGLENAQEKLRAKKLDWIVYNNLREEGAGFGFNTNRVTLISRDGAREDFPILPKSVLAERLVQIVAEAPALP